MSDSPARRDHESTLAMISGVLFLAVGVGSCIGGIYAAITGQWGVVMIPAGVPCIVLGALVVREARQAIADQGVEPRPSGL